ncbi:GAF domain-containing protein [Halobacterium zhouii]|uniref:GAF domain-containing protein n=1 Tax=Halobacterium zhouii TaxID=2902624 RepID=UPI001E3BE886|nr:GAF domain-containing protein [Halobacterium zhouii]
MNDDSIAAAQLHALAETTPDVLVTIDSDSRVQFVNPAVEEVLGYTPEALTGESLTTLMADDLGRRHLDAMERYLDTETRTLDWDAVELPGQHANGHEVPLEISFSEFTSDGERFFTGVIRDVSEQRRRSDQLERLNELGLALSEAETFDEACERALTAASDVLGLSIATIDLYDGDTGSLESCARTSRVDELVGDGGLFTAERGLPWQAFAQNEPRVYARLDEIRDVDADETLLESAMVLPIGKHGVLVSGETTPDAFSETTLSLARILVRNVEAAFDRLERETTLRERTTEVEEKNEELRRLERVNDEIRSIAAALRDADSSAEIQQLVCDRLANSDPYQFVWFGERDLSTGELVPSAWAGAEDGYLDEVTVMADGSETSQEPGGRAIQSREPQIQNDLRADPPFEPWRRAAVERGYRASVSVPVVYHDTLYGVLNLYSAEAGIFSATEEAVLSELGEMVGYAINAMEHYDALVSQDSIELEFAIRDTTDELLSFLREHEGTFRLQNVRRREGRTLRAFGVFEGVPTAAVTAFPDEHGEAADLTVVRSRGEETTVELAITGDSLIIELLDRGAVPTTHRATPEGGRVSIRIAKTASVRSFVELFERRYDDVELVARREAPGPVQDSTELERTYLDTLTDRQAEVLETAYFAGFFEQPRESSAADVAEMLDVSQPTVSRHIRSAEQKLYSMLFGGDER